DLTGGYIAQATFKIISEDDDVGFTFIQAVEIDLDRTPGNPLNLQPPTPKKGDPGPQVKAKIILNVTKALTPDHPPANHPLLKPANARMKVHPINLVAGKDYVISLNSNAFDSYLILESTTGQMLAEDDDGGGNLNARIEYRAEKGGSHRIVVSAFDG